MMFRIPSGRMTLAVALIVVAGAFQGAYALLTNPSNSINVVEGNDATAQDYLVSRHGHGGGNGHGHGGSTTTSAGAQAGGGGGNGNHSSASVASLNTSNKIATIAVWALLNLDNAP